MVHSLHTATCRLAALLATILVCLAADEPAAPVTKVITATVPTGHWKGWAKRLEHTPGWANTPPRPGEVTVVQTPLGDARTFSGKVEGADGLEDLQVGLVTLNGVYWVNHDMYHWQPVETDGTFTLIDEKRQDKNKAVIARAKGRPWVFCDYIFKAPESGRDIVLKFSETRTVTITAHVGPDGPPVDFFLEVIYLHQSWVHDNNPLGYMVTTRTPSKDKQLVVPLPPEPIALYISGDGAAPHWENIDPREADHFDFVLLEGGRVEGTVLEGDQPVAKAQIMLQNLAAPLSVRIAGTDEDGHFDHGGLVPGTYQLSCRGKRVNVQIGPGKTTSTTIQTQAK